MRKTRQNDKNYNNVIDTYMIRDCIDHNISHMRKIWGHSIQGRALILNGLDFL